jgi:hypothetical protein
MADERVGVASASAGLDVSPSSASAWLCFASPALCCCCCCLVRVDSERGMTKQRAARTRRSLPPRQGCSAWLCCTDRFAVLFGATGAAWTDQSDRQQSKDNRCSSNKEASGAVGNELDSASCGHGSCDDLCSDDHMVRVCLLMLADARRFRLTHPCHELPFFQQCCLGCRRCSGRACCCCSLSSFVRPHGEGSAGLRVCRTRAHAMGSLLGEWGHQDGVGRIHWSGDGIRAVPSVEATSSAAPLPPRSRLHSHQSYIRSFASSAGANRRWISHAVPPLHCVVFVYCPL